MQHVEASQTSGLGPISGGRRGRRGMPGLWMAAGKAKGSG
jgi:hypothetical protein